MITLEENFSEIWRAVAAQLVIAASSAKHPWHLMALATVSPDGFPQARNVVLREFEIEKPALWFHSDRRSPKILGLEISDGDAELLLYEPKQRRQLRCKVKVILHHNDTRARMRWDQAKESSRRCYLAEQGPSLEVETRQSTLPAEWQHKVPPAGESEPGFANFTAVECRIQQVDILQLNAQGSERCLLSFKDGTLTDGQWLAP